MSDERDLCLECSRVIETGKAFEPEDRMNGSMLYCSPDCLESYRADAAEQRAEAYRDALSFWRGEA